MPVQAPEATKAHAYGFGYPSLTILSMVMRPMAAASAASEPEMQAKKPQPRMVAVPKPERNPPTVASATSKSFSESPVLTSTSPVRMNKGTAIRAKASIPSNRASPNRLNGRTSVVSKMAMEPRPSTTHIGTAMMIINNITRRGPLNSHPRSMTACCWV